MKDSTATRRKSLSEKMRELRDQGRHLRCSTCGSDKVELRGSGLPYAVCPHGHPTLRPEAEDTALLIEQAAVIEADEYEYAIAFEGGKCFAVTADEETGRVNLDQVVAELEIEDRKAVTTQEQFDRHEAIFGCLRRLHWTIEVGGDTDEQ